MKRICLAILMVITISGVSRADILYSFRFSPTATSVAPGGQSIDIFLDQTATGVDVTNLETVGLGTANFTVNSSNLFTFTSASTGFVDDGVLGFTGARVNISAPGVAVFDQATLESPSLANGTLGTGGPNLATIRIGTVNFNLAAGQSTTLSTAAYTLNDFGLYDGSPVAAIAGANLTITAVPEPTSVALVGLLGLVGFVARHRRFKLESAKASV